MPGERDAMIDAGGPVQRADRWLWHARLFRTRSLAARFAASGKLRVNSQRVLKASHPVGPGDVLTFALSGRVSVLRIAALAGRRGPYATARTLYEDLSPPAPARREDAGTGSRPGGAGRPTKRERRRIASLASLAGDGPADGDGL